MAVSFEDTSVFASEESEAPSGLGGGDAARDSRSTGGTDSLQLFLKEIARYRLLTPHEEVTLSKRIERGDRRAKERMINSNLRLVVSIAKKHQGRDLAMLDLIQEGIIGLIRAAEKFDWRKGCRFSTYASWWVREAIERGVANRARMIRMPVYMIDRERMVTRIERALTAELGRGATEDEVAAVAKIPVEQVYEVRGYARSVTSLDKPVGEDGLTSFGELIESDDAEPAEEVESTMRCEAVRRALAKIPGAEREVLSLRYGIGCNAETLDCVAASLGISRDRVRRLEARGLALLGRRPEVAALHNAALH
jgi:RNA polymerase primary sigma factor